MSEPTWNIVVCKKCGTIVPRMAFKGNAKTLWLKGNCQKCKTALYLDTHGNYIKNYKAR